MTPYSFALYDAFSDRCFGGSQAAVIDSAAAIGRESRQLIARELGMPATAFIDDRGRDWISAQFMSTVMELPMCGHGTLCLLTYLLDQGVFALDSGETRRFELRLPRSTAVVEVEIDHEQRYRIMLDIEPPRFEPAPPLVDELLQGLGLDAGALAQNLPLETALGDFTHLLVPVEGLEAMRNISPDFNALLSLCHAHGIETVAVFCEQTEHPQNTIHVRDFCPAVGVSESAAAGTTNAALACYLWRQHRLPTDLPGMEVNAEQGIELGRPSSVLSRLTVDGKCISRLQVGGVATRVLDVQFYLQPGSR